MCKLHDDGLQLPQTAMLEAKHIMNGKVLRVTFVHVRIYFHDGSTQYTNDLNVYIQYPPAMTITKQSDGSFSYSGTQQETIDYIAKALNIK